MAYYPMKRKRSPSDLPVAANDLAADMFRVVPGPKLDGLGNVIPASVRPLLDSATVGVSGSHVIVTVNRIDPVDMPKLLNTEIYLFGYDVERRIIAPQGLHLYRCPAGWHHVDPSTEFADGITFDDIGVTGADFLIDGQALADVPRRTIHDALSQSDRYWSRASRR